MVVAIIVMFREFQEFAAEEKKRKQDGNHQGGE
jgi:hypothetical protein